jgi:hypothetical protein
MKPARASSICPCLSLLTGVELICLIDLIGKICCLAVVSSAEDLDVAGVRVPPGIQLVFGAWQLIGIGLLVGAAVGALYRIETHLRLYQLYWQASAIIYFFGGVIIAFSGNLCSTVISAEAMRHGTAVVCGFVDTFFLTWGCIGLGLCVYFGLVVGAAADEIASEIPTGLLERFRKAEEAKAEYETFPTYGAAGPRAMPVPWVPGVALPAAPVSMPPIPTGPMMSGPMPVHAASVPAMPVGPPMVPSAAPVLPSGPGTPVAGTMMPAQENPFAVK